MQRIADLRTTIADIPQADEAMRDIAKLECRLAVEKARLEKKITDLKAEYAERTAALIAEHSTLGTLLAGFITRMRGLFVKPRKRKTEFGSYGLETASEVEITNEAALVEMLMDLGYDDCLKVVRTPIKAALKARIEAGETLAHVVLKTGDTAVYKVSKALLDEAKESV